MSSIEAKEYKYKQIRNIQEIFSNSENNVKAEIFTEYFLIITANLATLPQNVAKITTCYPLASRVLICGLWVDVYFIMPGYQVFS